MKKYTLFLYQNILKNYTPTLLISSSLCLTILISNSTAIITHVIVTIIFIYLIILLAKKPKQAFLISICLLTMGINTLRVTLKNHHFNQVLIENNKKEIVTLTGIITKNQKTYLWLKEEKTKLNYIIFTSTLKTTYKRNETIKITGKIIPSNTPENPGQFNEKKYHKQHWICGKISPIKSQKIQSAPPYSIQTLAHKINQKIKNIHDKNLPYPYNQLLLGLVFGVKNQSLPQKMLSNIKESGLLHLIIVSGMQISLLSGLLFHILNDLFFSCRNFVSVHFRIIRNKNSYVGHSVPRTLMSKTFLGKFNLKQKRYHPSINTK